MSQDMSGCHARKCGMITSGGCGAGETPGMCGLTERCKTDSQLDALYPADVEEEEDEEGEDYILS